MNRYQFEDLISAYIENELPLTQRKEFEIYLKRNPDSQQLVDSLKINLKTLKTSSKINAKKDFNERLLTKIDSRKASFNTKVNSTNTIFGFSLFNATLMVSLFSLLIILTLEISGLAPIAGDNNGNKFAKNQSLHKKTMIQKEPEESLSNLNFTNSKNDTLKKKKVDYSKNIKFVND